MILDTSFIIDVMDGDQKALEKLRIWQQSGEVRAVTSVTVFELFSGVGRSQRPIEEKNKVLACLNGQQIFDLDWPSAEKAGEIDGALATQGKMIKPLDCLIAGIALINNEKLVTRNRKDFEKIQGLELETY